METVQTAITGNEPQENPDEQLAALSQFYRAFNGRDLELMERNWDHSDEASMDNPLGGIKRGWPEVRSVYERIFQASARVRVEFYDYTLHRAGDVFYVVGRERGEFVKDGKILRLAIRTSRIFRRNGDSEWRQVHHHGSIEAPELLAEYQAAIRAGAPT